MHASSKVLVSRLRKKWCHQRFFCPALHNNSVSPDRCLVSCGAAVGVDHLGQLVSNDCHQPLISGAFMDWTLLVSGVPRTSRTLIEGARKALKGRARRSRPTLSATSGSEKEIFIEDCNTYSYDLLPEGFCGQHPGLQP